MDMHKMELPTALIELMGDQTPKVDAVRVEYYVWNENGKWSAMIPALHGLKVSGLDSVGSASTALSAAIGRVGSQCGVNHIPIPWINVPADFVPPEGAIKKAFMVGRIEPGQE